jgi:hypothetical protein
MTLFTSTTKKVDFWTSTRHDPIGKGLLMEIIGEAGITKDEFLSLL